MQKIFSPEMLKIADQILKTQSTELILILRTHLIIESYLDSFLNNYFENGNGEILKLTFNQKVKIVKATGKVEKVILDSISRLNKIRNKYAHNLNYQITKKEIDSLFIIKSKLNKNQTFHTILLCLLAICHGELCIKN